MTDLFLERQFDPPLTLDLVLGVATESLPCFLTHRVDWHSSMLSLDGRRMFCWFSAADAESVRNALRQAGQDATVLWSGTVHEARTRPDAPPPEADVVVTRSFDEPVAVEDIQAIEDAGAHCLEAHRVRFVRTYFSRDRRRMLCLYHAPDAESVRLAQHQAGMPLDEVLACQPVRPDMLPG
jgi:hypothetical protein